MGKAVRAIVGVVLTVVGFVTGNPALIVQGAMMTFSALTSKDPKKATTTAAAENRLSKRLEPEAFRKIIFGETAAGLDMRYWEVWGTNAMSYDEVLANASHRITAYGDLYLNDELAIPSGSNAGTGKFAGIFSRNVCLEGVTGVRSVLAGQGAKWGNTSSLTGVAHMSLRYVYSQEKWPQNIPSRYTQVVKGAPVYDPRRDVSRGGTHVITNQATWEYLPVDSNGKPIGRNNALQVLWYLIGWRIAGKLVAGRGVDPSDLNLDAFIVAANDCETMGWYSDCILSTGDSHSTNEGVLSSASGGQILDTGGRYSYRVAVNDTANIAAYLTDDHIVGGIQWVPKRKMSEQFNEIAGTFVDPSPTALYQPRAFPMVWNQAYYDADGFKRRKTLALGAVQDAAQAQKLARIELNRGRLQGQFTATFNYAALQVENWSLVRLTFSRYGWVNKLFRVVEQAISPMGGIVMTLTEEDASVYLGGTVVTLPPPSAGTAYNASQKIAVGVVTVEPTSVVGAVGSAVDAMRVSWPSVDGSVKATQLRYRKSTDTHWTFYDGNLLGQTTVVVQPLLPGTFYEFQVRHISINDIIGDWSGVVDDVGTATRHTAGQVFYPAVTGLPEIQVSELRPRQAGADVTVLNTALNTQNVGARTSEQVLNDIVSKADASRVSVVEAQINTRPNLLVNPSGLQGATVGWTSDYPLIPVYTGDDGLGPAAHYRYYLPQTGAVVTTNLYQFISPFSLGVATIAGGLSVSCEAYKAVGSWSGRLAITTFGPGGFLATKNVSLLETGVWSRLTVTMTPAEMAGATQVLVAFAADLQPAAASSGIMAFRRMKAEFGPVATAFTDSKDEATLRARVTTEETATADLMGRTQARWALGTAVPGATAFIEARAEVTPGAAPTSSVAIGARQFAVFNSLGNDWKKALEVVGGNVVLSGGLQAGAFIRLGNGQGWPVALKGVDFSATDGGVVSFGTDLGQLPSLIFSMNNLLPLAAGETYDVKVTGLTATGFTLSAKINVPGTPTAHNDTTSATSTAFGAGGRTITRSGGLSADGTYRIKGTGTNRHDIFGANGGALQEDSYDFASSFVQVWALKSSVWQFIANVNVSSSVDRRLYPLGPATVAASWVLDETLQLGDNVSAVGIRHAENDTFAKVDTFTNLMYTAAGSASGTRTALASGATTKIRVQPQ